MVPACAGHQDRAVSRRAARDLADRRRPRVLAPFIALNLLALFALALACHGEVYARRPAPALLTEFYLWTSFGGVIGGMFAGLLAPHIFNRTFEYPILIVAALLALPGALSGSVRSLLWRISPALGGCGTGDPAVVRRLSRERARARSRSRSRWWRWSG